MPSCCHVFCLVSLCMEQGRDRRGVDWWGHPGGRHRYLFPLTSTDSLTHSPTGPFTHSLIHSLTRDSTPASAGSPMSSIPPSFTCSLTWSFVSSLIQSCMHSSAGTLLRGNAHTHLFSGAPFIHSLNTHELGADYASHTVALVVSMTRVLGKKVGRQLHLWNT